MRKTGTMNKITVRTDGKTSTLVDDFKKAFENAKPAAAVTTTAPPKLGAKAPAKATTKAPAKADAAPKAPAKNPTPASEGKVSAKMPSSKEQAETPEVAPTVGKGGKAATSKTAPKPAAKAKDPAKPPREKGIINTNPSGVKPKAARVGTKTAAILTLLNSPNGGTPEQFSAEISKFGEKRAPDQVSGWIMHAAREKGYGVRTEVNKNGKKTYHLVLPAKVSEMIPHVAKEAPKPKAAPKAKASSKEVAKNPPKAPTVGKGGKIEAKDAAPKAPAKDAAPKAPAKDAAPKAPAKAPAKKAPAKLGK
jgi:hypothetical protein